MLGGAQSPKNPVQQIFFKTKFEKIGSYLKNNVLGFACLKDVICELDWRGVINVRTWSCNFKWELVFVDRPRMK